eukprot:7661237-Prorocentrum_lima.AAC.1
MTSSLVGSEMCIRDRDMLMLRKTTAWPALPGNDGRIWRKHRPCTIRPVSYTHLTLPTICSV